MFIDASVIIAVLARESDAADFASRLARLRKSFVSPIVVYEAVLGLARATKMSLADAKRLVAMLLANLSAECVSVTPERGELAIAAFERFGKGRHPAALNMGDCFAYACAQDLQVPLLFKGDDFSRTDIEVA
jgi:ribonuclease VapC